MDPLGNIAWKIPDQFGELDSFKATGIVGNVLLTKKQEVLLSKEEKASLLTKILEDWTFEAMKSFRANYTEFIEVSKASVKPDQYGDDSQELESFLQIINEQNSQIKK
jgi:hypothetical protein